MKKLSFIAINVAVAAGLCFTACAGSNEKEVQASADSTAVATNTKTVDADTVGFAPTTNIRYIDEEELLNEYNLAKDFKEASMRAMSKLESAQQSKANELQQLQNSIETKMRNNTYTTEAQYNADVAQYQKKQQEAQNYLGNLQRNTELEMQQQQSQLMDSIQSYIRLYNTDKHYDAILFKSAGVYFNPSLDITKDIIKGLNDRYNKK